MSGGLEPFALQEDDAMKLLATYAHIGSPNVDFQMEQYVFNRRVDGTYIINLKKTWEKILFAARAIAAVENPSDVVVVSARPYAQRALLKFAAHTGATAIFGRFSPGCLTNQIQKSFKEPRLLVISDPRIDHQAVREASYVGVPVISFCNTESPLKLIDIAIPCNNKGEKSIGLMWWFLAREILILRGKISRQTGFVLDGKEIMPDLYFYRDPHEAEKEEAGEVAPIPTSDYSAPVEPSVDFTAAPDVQNWADETANWNINKPAEGQEWANANAVQQWEMKAELIKEYPLEEFPNWNILSREKYYVPAPIDGYGEWAFHSNNSEFATKLAFMFSRLGLEEFFFSLIVAMVWLFDVRLGYLLAVLLGIGFFFSGVLKVGLCLPRPPAPPALRLSEENFDWAWPSNHSLLGTAFPWFIWIYSTKHYELSFWSSLLLLTSIFVWNCGVSWSRIYLGVHSPCDVLGGWTIGVLILFIFSGYSDRLYELYVLSSGKDSNFFLYMYTAILVLLQIHPRAWPETQILCFSLVSVLAGVSGIWCTRILELGGASPFKSLRETTPDAPVYMYLVRFLIGTIFALIARILIKTITKFVVTQTYKYLGLRFYSYTGMCKSMGDLQPTKRYTNRMRFSPIPGHKVIRVEDAPYDIDLPVKFFTYSAVGFMVGEGCPFLFELLGL
ncbi:unnamed protein product [Auanema sp. JU1783]|nr:unnamed protein product [Auanema sp. JU1783]